MRPNQSWLPDLLVIDFTPESLISLSGRRKNAKTMPHCHSRSMALYFSVSLRLTVGNLILVTIRISISTTLSLNRWYWIKKPHNFYKTSGEPNNNKRRKHQERHLIIFHCQKKKKKKEKIKYLLHRDESNDFGNHFKWTIWMNKRTKMNKIYMKKMRTV